MPTPRPRIESPERHQQGFHAVSLDELIAEDHRVRLVWRYVERLDVSGLEGQIRSVEGGAGRPAIDPRLLLALWLYATIDGVGSARALARLCDESLPYRWLCGGVSVNHHTLSDFRTGKKAFLDDLLTRSVASLLHAGAVTLNRVAQDGMRVRASAGAASFRRRSTLQDRLREARAHLTELERELAEDPASGTLRQQAARLRAAQEQEARIEAALAATETIDGEDPRASTTDPDARIMKMPDGGCRPAYNVQFTTTTDTGVIVGVTAVNRGSDYRQLVPMLQQLVDRYGEAPRQHLVDGGFVSRAAIDSAAGYDTTVFSPVPDKRHGRDPHEPSQADSATVAEWRQRMATPEAKAIYGERGRTAEWANALARNRGLVQIPVRGLEKATCIALWFALAHNLMVTAGWT